MFFAARDASSAAEAQQTLNAIWDQLLELPVYKLFRHPNMSHEHLMGDFRRLSDEVDGMMTIGTERNKSFNMWLERLTTLSEDLYHFEHDTHFMLDSYFNDLKQRMPNAYAEAFAHYRSAASAQFELDLERQKETGDITPVPYVETLHPTEIMFITIVDSANPGRYIIAERMTFADLGSFLYVDLFKGMATGHIPRLCHNCGRYFLLTAGCDIRYCTSIAPGEIERTCRQVGAHRKEKAKIGSDFVRREYSKLYNRLKQRKNRGTLSIDEWNQQIAVAQDIKDQALRGEIGEAELKKLFGTF